MGIGIPRYSPTGTRETQVPGYVIPVGSATRGYGYGLSKMTGIPVYPSIYIYIISFVISTIYLLNTIVN